jgi:CRISPR-associated protein Csb1
MTFDDYLLPSGPVALTIREYLEPVQGKHSVLFPPTFAPPEGSKEKPSYIIDETTRGKVSLVDSVGSQANRSEPLFKKEPYSKLVPQITVKVGERLTSLLDAGHRAADAVVRFSDQAGPLKAAFIAIRDRGDSSLLARIAPTSLVFGAWDSRDTRVKLPRIIGSVVRAYGIDPLSRSAQFSTILEKEETESLGIDQEFLSNQGLSDSPAGRGPGGVIAREGVIREATLNLIVLRSLAGSTEEETGKLQRYILGLALVAFFAPAELFLREGCLLTISEDKATEVKEVFRDGHRNAVAADTVDALCFAQKAASDFRVGPNLVAEFSGEKVKAAKGESEKKNKAKKPAALKVAPESPAEPEK